MWFPSLDGPWRRPRWQNTLAVALLLAFVLAARADLPEFLQHAVAGSTVELALFRLMHGGAGEELYPRPPREAVAGLSELVAARPGDAELLQLRARSEEQLLDFKAAEADWQSYARATADHGRGELELANYYGRRLMVPQEVDALAAVAASPESPAERLRPPDTQRAWRASERELLLIEQAGLPVAAEDQASMRFIARYPHQPFLYVRYFNVLLDRRDYPAAAALLQRYRESFPADRVFPVEAAAAIRYRQGDSAGALAVYSEAFDPLWPQPLVESYFALLARTHQQHVFLAQAEARLAANPDSLDDAVRVFFFFQQMGTAHPAYGGYSSPDAGTTGTEGAPAAATAVLARYRISKETRHAAWSPLELMTLATLSRGVGDWPEAARYFFALTAAPGTLPDGVPAAQSGLAGLTGVLLTAPDQPIALGAGDLSLYQDIATLDSGPGYWNGILSLWLNGTDPAGQYATETNKAQPFFHRGKAAELLSRLDREYPNASGRPALHLKLLQASAQYGEPASTIAGGKRYLAMFPRSSGRVEVAILTADAYAQTGNTADEFALYDRLLGELAKESGGQPLSASGYHVGPRPDGDAAGQGGEDTVTPQRVAAPAAPDQLLPPAPATEVTPATEASAAYAQLLDRYLGRLTATGHVPEALAVLRRQLDGNPDDPRLYERLAAFLQSNNLSAAQEGVYKLAIARFPGTVWYDRLGRFYLRQRRQADFAAITRTVTAIFSGTELDGWFAKVSPSDKAVGPALALQLDLYAAQRFPHDLVFTEDALRAYRTAPTANAALWSALIRRHWWESPALRDQFFEELSRTGRLGPELAQLEATQPGQSAQTARGDASTDPLAARELADGYIWTSRFERATPLLAAVSALYPADSDLGDRTESLFRSFAYGETGLGESGARETGPGETGLGGPAVGGTADGATSGTFRARAIAVEQRLLVAAPDSPDRLLTLGDLYAESTATGGEDIRAAAPYWRRIPQLHAGDPSGYLTSATVFWDYFQFDDAFAEIQAARTRFGSPALFAYEAGAIEENRHDLPAAVREYTAAVVRPPGQRDPDHSAVGTVGALFAPPAADSASQASGSGMFGSDQARQRLLELAVRPATASLVDDATAKALEAYPGEPALVLRADVLVAARRTAELAPALTAALARTQTPEQAAAIGTLASQHDLTAVYQASLERQTTLSVDPVERIRLQFALVRSLETRKNIPDATRVQAAVYAANPRLLGVVRATVDFYARTAQPKRAVQTLLEAAHAATPELADQLTLEAADRSNRAGDTALGRQLALGLLQGKPYDPRYLAVAADSYARAQDDPGLKAFYLARLALVRTAALSPAEQRADTALLRRGLIPALTRLGDTAGATDQYEALLRAYPEDLLTGAAATSYALAHGTEPQLLLFLSKAVADSPQDSRFAILLAQTDTAFGDLPGAVAAYTAAIGIRADRADLFQDRAALELRLADTDANGGESAKLLEAAAGDYGRLYGLSYHDPAWLVQLGRVRVRQGRAADAVHALDQAYVAGGPTTGDAAAAGQFAVAAQLERWNLLAEARAYAERGRSLAGPTFLLGSAKVTAAGADAEDATDAAGDGGAYDSGAGDSASATDPGATASDAALYARIATRQGRPEDALAALLAARQAASANSPAAVAALVAGLGAEADGGSAKQFAQSRQKLIEQSYAKGVLAVAGAVGRYGTPEEKGRVARLFDAGRGATPAHPRMWIHAAHLAGLADREADWRRAALLGKGPGQPVDDESLAAYVALEQSRLRFAELGKVLEIYAGRVRPDDSKAVLGQAVQAFDRAGDEADALRLERQLAFAGDAGLRDRFLDRLLREDPGAYDALAASSDGSLADAAANEAIARGTPAEALGAVGARARALPAVWGLANTALVGLYFSSAPGVDAHRTDTAFRAALGTEATIGDRLSTPADPARQLVGAAWFPYGSAYGVFRLLVPDTGDPEDYAASELEAGVAGAGDFARLARSYDEAGRTEAALVEYGHALELAPDDPAVLDAEAELLLATGHREQALAAWQTALRALAASARRGRLSDSFWTGFRALVAHLGQRQLLGQFGPEVVSVVQPYLAANGTYRSNELLQAVYRASSTPAQGTALLLSCTAGAPAESPILGNLRAVPLTLASSPNAGERGSSAFATVSGELTDDVHEAILLRRIALAAQHSTQVSTDGDVEVLMLRLELVQAELDRNQLAAAAAQFARVGGSAASRTGFEEPLAVDRMVLAVRTGALAPLLAEFSSRPDAMPSPKQFDGALKALQRATPDYQPNPGQILPLADYAFAADRRTASLTTADFLTVAQLHLDGGDVPGAVGVLHALALQSPAPAVLDASVEPSGVDAVSDAEVADTSNVVPDAGAEAGTAGSLSAAAALLERGHHPAEAVEFLSLLVRDVPWNVAYRLRLGEAERAANMPGAGLTLRAVAAEVSAPYAMRVAAAERLQGSGTAPGDLGSAELALLEGAPPSPAAARQPFFAAARVAAAAGQDQDLLREAIAIAPEGRTGDRARLALLRLDLSHGAWQRALTLVRTAPAGTSDESAYRFYGGTSEESDPAESGESDDPGPDPSGGDQRSEADGLPAFASTLSGAEQSGLLLSLAHAAEETGDLQGAIAYLDVVSKTATAAPAGAGQESLVSARAAAVRERGRLVDLVRLRRANAGRRPILTASVDSGSGAERVRPKLYAPAATPGVPVRVEPGVPVRVEGGAR